MARESRFALRLPPDLYERIRSEAEQGGISINEYIVRALASHLGMRDEFERRLLDLEQRRLITMEERIAALERTAGRTD